MRRPQLCRLIGAIWCGLALGALPCFGAGNPSGINLRWNACYAEGGAANRVFACNTNGGTESLAMTVVHNSTITSVSGCEITIEVAASGTTLPSWWQAFNTGTCRRFGVSFNSISTPTTSQCEDVWRGAGVGGIGAYNIGFYGANTARIRIAVAVPISALGTINPGIEYHVGNLTVSHIASVGSGSCSGCLAPVCLWFADAKITTPVAANDVLFTLPASDDNSNWASWQDGTSAGVVPFTCVNGSLRAPRVAPR